MKKRDDELGWFMGWLAAIVMTTLSFIAFLAATRATGSGTVITNFIFDFQTLIAGIFASGAAAVTVYYIRRQMGVAQMQARDTLAIALRRAVAISVKGKAAANELDALAHVSMFTVERLVDPNGWRLFNRILKRYREAIDDEIFGLVEGEVGYPQGHGVTFVRTFLDDFQNDFSLHFTYRSLRPSDAQTVLTRWQMFEEVCESYAFKVFKICDGFLKENEAMLARYE